MFRGRGSAGHPEGLPPRVRRRLGGGLPALRAGGAFGQAPEKGHRGRLGRRQLRHHGRHPVWGGGFQGSGPALSSSNGPALKFGRQLLILQTLIPHSKFLHSSSFNPGPTAPKTGTMSPLFQSTGSARYSFRGIRVIAFIFFPGTKGFINRDVLEDFFKDSGRGVGKTA